MRAAELFAVTGKPVGHSLSPELFRLCFQAFSQNAVYTRLAADSAREALDVARAIGLRGLNVTSPFKEEMMPLVDRVDEHVAKIGAVNGLALAARNCVGYNTDFIGLIGTLYSKGIDPAGRAALVLGTGGAARAAAYGLVRAKARRVLLASRSLDRARAAARSLGCEAVLLDDAAKTSAEVDICVSCLPFPVSHVLPDPSPGGPLIVDAHYASAPPSPNGASRAVSPALSWLFHQAIPSFEIFTNLKVPEARKRQVWEEFLAREASPKPHIALVGFMGTGKTSVGRALARLMGRDFADTDEIIEAAAGLSIPQVFRQRGEDAFRSLEKSTVESLVSAGGSQKVISVGGGAILDEDNRSALAGTCRVVWLWAPARTALSRVDVRSRPVLDPDRPLESAERTLAARLPLYAAVADLIISATGGSPLEVARRVKDEMGQAL
jgi:shikimate dehydrogenase